MGYKEDNRAVGAFADGQIAQWETFKKRLQSAPVSHPVITVCMEPGSGGSLVGKQVAETLGFDYFHRELLEVMSITAKVDTKVLQRLEKERLSGMEDVISQMLDDRYLYPGLYMEYLQKVVRTVSRRGRSVLVGRGANFILPPEERLSVLLVAPREFRIQRVAEQYGVLPEDAEKRVDNRQKKRSSFVRKNFGQDISDPVHYDLTINTGVMSLEDATRTICQVWCGR